MGSARRVAGCNESSEISWNGTSRRRSGPGGETRIRRSWLKIARMETTKISRGGRSLGDEGR